MEAHVNALQGAYKQVADRLNSVDSRLNSVDSRLNSMDSRLNSMDSRLDSMDSRLDSMDSRLDNLGETLRAKMDRQFMWMVGLILGCGVGIITMWVTTMQAIVGLAKTTH
jgi:tetrahydromethanopterin S-methyltransferase subunit G